MEFRGTHEQIRNSIITLSKQGQETQSHEIFDRLFWSTFKGTILDIIYEIFHSKNLKLFNFTVKFKSLHV